MYVEVMGEWTDKDMKSFPHLKERTFSVDIDVDYIDDYDSLIGTISDEIYRKYQIVFNDLLGLRKCLTNLDEIERECF